MREVVHYAIELGGPLGILLLVLCALALAGWYVLIRLLGKEDGIVTRNVSEVKDEFVRFLHGLDHNLQTLSAYHESQDREFTMHCSNNHSDHAASHQALGALLDTSLALVQSNDVLTNGEKKRVEEMLIRAKATLKAKA